MKVTVQEIAFILGGSVEGNSSTEVSGLSKIEQGKPGTLSFLANPKYTQFIYETQASAVLVSEDFSPEKEFSTTLIRVKDPYSAFTTLLEKFQEALLDKKGIHPLAFVSESAVLGEEVYVGPFAFIGENAKLGNKAKVYPGCYVGDLAEIGENSTLFAQVTLYHACRIGNNCTVHSGSVIGSDGFGFAPQEDGTFKKIPQTGIVVLEDEVEIGSNSTIDRATLGETLIKKGTKIDNLVQIAHNVEIGEYTVVAAQSGISGSSKLGANCMIGGQVGIVGHIELATGTKVGAQSGVSKTHKEENKVLRGSPAQGLRQQLKSEALFRQLDKMEARIRDLEKKLAKFEAE